MVVNKLCQLIAQVLVAIFALSVQSAADDLITIKSSDKRHPWTINVVNGNDTPMCRRIIRYLKPQASRIPDGCALPFADPKSEIRYVQWSSIDYRGFVDSIKSAYIQLENNAGTFAQAQFGPSHPELRSASNPHYYIGVGNLFWQRYGMRILEEFAAGRVSLEAYDLKYGSSQVTHRIYRVPILEPRNEKSEELWTPTCEGGYYGPWIMFTSATSDRQFADQFPLNGGELVAFNKEVFLLSNSTNGADVEQFPLGGLDVCTILIQPK